MTQLLQPDAELLAAYARRRDANAFAELARRYAGLVYGVSLRITRNAADAEDVTQQCFLTLARQALPVTAPLPAWLHTLAYTRAIDAVRRSGTRRKHEQQAGAASEVIGPSASEEAEWAEISRQIDGAIASLPEDLRHLVIRHHLHGTSQVELARELGISQPTLSRRLSEAVEQLRAALQQSGVVASTALVAGVLQHAQTAQIPEHLLADLGRMGLAGIKSTVPTTTTAAKAIWLATAAVLVVVITAAVSLLTSGGTMSTAPTTTSPTPTALRPVQEMLSFTGNIDRHDSFSLAMQALARSYGRPISYDDLYVLSGNCFAPDIREEEPSKHMWQYQGRGHNLDLVCSRLGLSIRQFPTAEELHPNIPPMPKGDAAVQAWINQYYREPAIPVIRQAIERGELVFSMGEWFHRNGVCWTEWGVLASARTGASIQGYASNGRGDNAVDYVRDGWIIGPPLHDPVAWDDALDREVLRRAVKRLRGELPSGDRNVLFGVKAMDAWIAQMQKTPFCPECKERSANCARLTALSAFEASQAAATYLKRLSAKPGDNAAQQTLFHEASKHYVQIAQLLQPYADPNATITSLSVRHEGPITWLDPIPRYPRTFEVIDDAGNVITRESGFVPHRDDQHGMLFTAMHMLAPDITFEQSFAAGGFPWRFSIANDWAHDAENITPVDEYALAAQTLGFGWEWIRNRDIGPTTSAIAKHIEAGHPVLIGLDARFWCIIVGIDRQRNEYLVIGRNPNRDWPPARYQAGQTILDTFTRDECIRVPIPTRDFYASIHAPGQLARNPAFALTGYAAVDPRTAAATTLRSIPAISQPVTMDRASLDLHAKGQGNWAWTPRPGNFTLGNEAIRHWANRLEPMRVPTHNFGFIHAVDTTLGMQLRTASDASAYLKQVAPLFDEPARGHLLSAANFLARTMEDQRILTCYVGYLPQVKTVAELKAAIEGMPAIVYIADPSMLGLCQELNLDIADCPWGLSVLSDVPTFQKARDLAVARLREIADLRDQAFAEIAAAQIPDLGAIQLGAASYQIQPLIPDQPLPALPPADPASPYAGHLMPYYNIHCELADEPTDALDSRIHTLGQTYEQYWQSLPAIKLPTCPFALCATRDGKLAGYIRFYSADRSTLRNLKARQATTPDTLLIGGCAFALDSLNAGLDQELLKRVIADARRSGYTRLQAIAWPDVRAFALWGEGIRRSIYRSEGFKPIAVEPADPIPLSDICSGAHGAEIQKLAREEVPPNVRLGPLGELHLMELDLTAPAAATGYNAIIGDLAKQQEHARTVLLPVKQELLAAADAIERALPPRSAPATQPFTLRTMDDPQGSNALDRRSP